MTQEPQFDVPTSEGVNRTQEAGAYARFHYKRGFEDGSKTILDTSGFLLFLALIVFASFSCGWLVRKIQTDK